MRRKSLTGMMLVLTGLSANTFAADANDCLKTLVKNVSSVQSTSASSYALIELIKRNVSTSDQSSMAGTITYDGVTAGLNSSEAQKYSSEFLKQTNVNWDQKTMINMVSETLPDNAVEAYKTCTLGQQTVGTRVFAYDATSDTVTVKVKWISGFSAPSTSPATLNVSGAVKPPPTQKPWKNQEERIFTLNRLKGKDLTFSATIGGSVDKIFVPYVQNVVVGKKLHQGVQFPDHDIRIENDGRGTNILPFSDCATPMAGWEIVPGSARIKMSAHAGNLNERSYAKVIEDSPARACYEASLIPLTAEGGGIIVFRLTYDEMMHTYTLVN